MSTLCKHIPPNTRAQLNFTDFILCESFAHDCHPALLVKN